MIDFILDDEHILSYYEDEDTIKLYYDRGHRVVRIYEEGYDYKDITEKEHNKIKEIAGSNIIFKYILDLFNTYDKENYKEMTKMFNNLKRIIKKKEKIRI